jgi:transcriptional antiterminator Rof (Rho-off)
MHKLSPATIARIEKEAEEANREFRKGGYLIPKTLHYESGYKAGATAEALRAQASMEILARALKSVTYVVPSDTRNRFAHDAIAAVKLRGDWPLGAEER